MSLVYHEKTCNSDYSETPPPPPKKKKKKKQGGRSGSPCQIGIAIRQTQKPLSLYQKDSTFMTLKEVHIENVKKGEKCWF